MTQGEKVKLTTLTTKGGCGCKIGPADLAQVIRTLPPAVPNANVLVGLETSDDAGVYRLTDDLAIVQTLDFFTPIVDDPYDFGQVAAANALSDIYAMGGTPITALNIVAFPISSLDKNILADILRGAADKLAEANVALIGGHSIDDKEPKFGLSVTGTVHPDKVRANSHAQVGDRLILTKPIGVGILSSGIKNNLLQQDEIDRITKVMATLNKTAAEVMAPFDIHACTDVTGFGLLGHASEMAKGSNVGLRIEQASVPVLPRVREIAEKGIIPGGTKNNFAHLQGTVLFPETMDQVDQWILCDAVTSGGLFVSIAADKADAMLLALRTAGVEASMIGEVVAEHPGQITVK